LSLNENHEEKLTIYPNLEDKSGQIVSIAVSNDGRVILISEFVVGM
jgi:predicted HAD superfamily hydrolase